MKTPEEVRAYTAKKKAKVDEEMRKREVEFEQERQPYLTFLKRELDKIVDKSMEDGSITERGGTIDIEMIIRKNEHRKFGKFAGDKNRKLVQDVIQYLQECGWAAGYARENKVYSGQEPPSIVSGDFVTIIPIE